MSVVAEEHQLQEEEEHEEEQQQQQQQDFFTQEEHERRVEEFAGKLLRALHAALRRHAASLIRMRSLGKHGGEQEQEHKEDDHEQQQQQQQQRLPSSSSLFLSTSPEEAAKPSKTRQAILDERRALERSRNSVAAAAASFSSASYPGEQDNNINKSAVVLPPIFSHSNRGVLRRNDSSATISSAVQHGSSSRSKSADGSSADDADLDEGPQRAAGEAGNQSGGTIFLSSSSIDVAPLPAGQQRQRRLSRHSISLFGGGGGGDGGGEQTLSSSPPLLKKQSGHPRSAATTKALFELPSKKQLRELKILAFALRDATTKLSAKVNREKQHALQRVSVASTAARSLMRENELVEDMLLVSSARNVLSHLEGNIATFRQKRRRARLVAATMPQTLLDELGILVNRTASVLQQQQQQRAPAEKEEAAQQQQEEDDDDDGDDEQRGQIGNNNQQQQQQAESRAVLPVSALAGEPQEDKTVAPPTQKEEAQEEEHQQQELEQKQEQQQQQQQQQQPLKSALAGTTTEDSSSAASGGRRRSNKKKKKAQFQPTVVAEEQLADPQYPHLPAILRYMHEYEEEEQQREEFEAAVKATNAADENAASSKQREQEEQQQQPQQQQKSAAASSPLSDALSSPSTSPMAATLPPPPQQHQHQQEAGSKDETSSSSASSLSVAELLARARATLNDNKDLLAGPDTQPQQEQDEQSAAEEGQQQQQPADESDNNKPADDSAENSSNNVDSDEEGSSGSGKNKKQHRKTSTAPRNPNGFLIPGMGGGSIGLREGSNSDNDKNNSNKKAKDFARRRSSAFGSMHRQESSANINLLSEMERDCIKAAQQSTLRRVPSALHRYTATDRDQDLTTINKTATSLATAVANARSELAELSEAANAGRVDGRDVALVGMLMRESEDLLGEMKPITSLLAEEQKLRRQFVHRVRSAATGELNDLTSQLMQKQREVARRKQERRDLIKEYLMWQQTRRADAAMAADTFESHIDKTTKCCDVGTQCSVPKEAVPVQLVKTVRLMQEIPNLQRHVAEVRKLVVELSSVDTKSEEVLRCQACGDDHVKHRYPGVAAAAGGGGGGGSPTSPTSPTSSPYAGVLHDAFLVWPCGDTICAACAKTVMIEYKDQPFKRCPACKMISLTEAFSLTPNRLVNDVAAKWLFKQSGFSDVAAASDALQQRLMAFKREEVLRTFEAVQQAVAESEDENSASSAAREMAELEEEQQQQQAVVG